MLSFITELSDALAPHGFRQLAGAERTIPEAQVLLKRQTFNTNRAVVVVAPSELPIQFDEYLADLRKRVAFRCGFFPFFYGIGIQVVLAAPGIARSGLKPDDYVARVDNQWAIVQSLFLVDTQTQSCVAARTWAQFVTGKYQDAIAEVLRRHYSDAQDGATHAA